MEGNWIFRGDRIREGFFDAFYSPAAQARLNPPRRELQHLTNAQYAISVADLLGGLAAPSTAPEAPAPATGGLSAVYYTAAQRGRFDAAKAGHRGVDPGVDLEFTPGSPALARAGAAG